MTVRVSVAGVFAGALVTVVTLATLTSGLGAAAQVAAPAPATPESIAAGQQLYLRHCASCHGRTGEGGPGNDLIPAAPSLVDDQWDHGSTDEKIFENVKNGIGPDFNMVPFKDKLTDDDIRNVVRYIRSMKKK